MNMSRLIRRAACFVCQWCASLPAFLYAPALLAQTEVAKTRVDPMSAEYVVKTVVGMIVVIGIIVALAWLVRRMGKMNGLMSGEVKIVSSLSLGAREKIVLVQVGEEQFLLGATPQQINRIARIKSPISPAVAAVPAERLTFQQLFAKLKHGPRV